MLKSSSESTASTVKSASSDNTAEIVPKDKDGGYELDIPVLPALLEGDDADDMSAVDDSAAGAGAGAAPTDSTGETEINGREKESMLSQCLLRSPADIREKKLRRVYWL